MPCGVSWHAFTSLHFTSRLLCHLVYDIIALQGTAPSWERVTVLIFCSWATINAEARWNIPTLLLNLGCIDCSSYVFLHIFAASQGREGDDGLLNAHMFNPFTPKSYQFSNFSGSLTRNITSHSMENLAFHSFLRLKMIILPILTISLIHLSLKGWENVLFELGSERVNRIGSSSTSLHSSPHPPPFCTKTLPCPPTPITKTLPCPPHPHHQNTPMPLPTPITTNSQPPSPTPSAGPSSPQNEPWYL